MSCSVIAVTFYSFGPLEQGRRVAVHTAISYDS